MNSGKNELPKLENRCLEAVKKGKHRVTILKLKNRHLSRNHTLEEMSYYKKNRMPSNYEEFISDPAILHMIWLIEKKGISVKVRDLGNESWFLEHDFRLVAEL